jgi:O-6-methylguanine DNA methyltransferase
MKSFKERVLEVVRNIPKGETLSYKEVAMRAGSINGARAVGMIMSRNQDLNIPCHRVIRSDGKMGGYNGIRSGIKGIESKRKLLKEEMNGK